MQFDTLTLQTMDGLTLKGDLAVPDRCVGAAVVCHPHPLYGGDRFNPVVGAVVKAFHQAGFATVRFDFRGVNESQGTHSGGVDERMDALAALEVAENYVGVGPLVMAGYSFGSMVALEIVHPRVDVWLAVAPPLAVMPSDVASAPDPRPKHLLVPEHDQYTPPAAAAEKSAGWLNTTIDIIPMADHFMAGRTAAVGELVATFVSALVGP